MRSLFNGNVVYSWTGDNKFTGLPKTVVHYAKQPSAPYSLINYKYTNMTIYTNLLVTNNLMFAVRDYSRDAHIIKLCTMGEYGTPNIDIEEGWIDIEHRGRKDKFLFPRQASSLYHTTKIMETFSVNQLADKVQNVGKKLGHNVEIKNLENPRKEAEDHYYNPTYQELIELGIKPHYLTDEVLEGMFRVVEQFKGNIRKDEIFHGIRWG